MVLSRHQNAGHIHNVLVAIKSFENVAKFKYLGQTVMNKNCIHEEPKSRLHLRNACLNLVQNLLFSHLLSEKLKIEIYQTIILLVSCMGVKLGLSHYRKSTDWRGLRTEC
jgi:hypothetical protein